MKRNRTLHLPILNLRHIYESKQSHIAKKMFKLKAKTWYANKQIK